MPHVSRHQLQVPVELEHVNHWLVLDGPLEASTVRVLEMLVRGEGITLPNGDTLLLPRMCSVYMLYAGTCLQLCDAYALLHVVGSCWLLLETPRLTHITPSLLSHSTLLHFSRGILSYEAIVDTWLDRAPTQHNLSAMRYTHNSYQ